MEQANPESKTIDFELRRAARRRVITLLEEHQQGEAEAARKTAESLIDFYEGALKSIGRWIVREPLTSEEESQLQSFAEFTRWKAAAARMKQAVAELDAAQQVLSEALLTISRIEPNALIRPWSNKPGMREAKARRDSASYEVLLKKEAESLAEQDLRSAARQLLLAIVARIDDVPKEIPARQEVDQLMIEQLEVARTCWLAHRSSENQGLVEVIKLTQVLAESTGDQNAN
ncbi:MAG: hypothetical protein L6Q31_01220 [Fimbriimonadaceae bacterium]|nr:hypothetical protein [Fimbriimonadaceae bacterium]